LTIFVAILFPYEQVKTIILKILPKDKDSFNPETYKTTISTIEM